MDTVVGIMTSEDTKIMNRTNYIISTCVLIFNIYVNLGSFENIR